LISASTTSRETRQLRDFNVRFLQEQIADLARELERLDAAIATLPPGQRVGVLLALDEIFHGLRGFLRGIEAMRGPALAEHQQLGSGDPAASPATPVAVADATLARISSEGRST
jgi:hypothetical protein